MPRTQTTIVSLSSQLRDYCGGSSQILVSAPNVRAAFARFEQDHPLLYRSVCDETGAVRRHVNVFVNASNIRDLDGLDTVIEPGDVVTILPAVSGG